MKIIYIHGFNSVGSGNEKALMLAEHFGCTVGAPNLPPNPDEAIAQLIEMINSFDDKDDLILVGTSLGGYYAQYLSKTFGIKCVLINPSLHPSVTLASKVGRLKNYATGVEYDFTAEHVAQFDKYSVDPGADPLVPTIVCLDMGDELLDSYATVKHFAPYAQLLLFPEGNHRFVHMREILPAIARLEHIMYQ